MYPDNVMTEINIFIYFYSQNVGCRNAIRSFVAIELRISIAVDRKCSHSLLSDTYSREALKTSIPPDCYRFFYKMSCPPANTSVNVLLPDVMGLALDLVPAEVHVSCLVRAASSQSSALCPLLLPLTVHCGLARHTVASRPRGPPRS